MKIRISRRFLSIFFGLIALGGASLPPAICMPPDEGAGVHRVHHPAAPQDQQVPAQQQAGAPAQQQPILPVNQLPQLQLLVQQQARVPAQQQPILPVNQLPQPQLPIQQQAGVPTPAGPINAPFSTAAFLLEVAQGKKSWIALGILLTCRWGIDRMTTPPPGVTVPAGFIPAFLNSNKDLLCLSLASPVGIASVVETAWNSGVRKANAFIEDKTQETLDRMAKEAIEKENPANVLKEATQKAIATVENGADAAVNKAAKEAVEKETPKNVVDALMQKAVNEQASKVLEKMVEDKLKQSDVPGKVKSAVEGAILGAAVGTAVSNAATAAITAQNPHQLLEQTIRTDLDALNPKDLLIKAIGAAIKEDTVEKTVRDEAEKAVKPYVKNAVDQEARRQVKGLAAGLDKSLSDLGTGLRALDVRVNRVEKDLGDEIAARKQLGETITRRNRELEIKMAAFQQLLEDRVISSDARIQIRSAIYRDGSYGRDHPAPQKNLENMCNGKTHCVFDVSNNQLRGGEDPHKGYAKILSVSYACKDSKTGKERIHHKTFAEHMAGFLRCNSAPSGAELGWKSATGVKE